MSGTVSGRRNRYLTPFLVGGSVLGGGAVAAGLAATASGARLTTLGLGDAADEGDIVTGAGQVKFGSDANQSYHTFRHVEEAGIDKQAAESAVRNDLARKGSSLPQGLTKGQVNVGGRVLQYNAYKFPDGTINVGRITVR